MTEFDKNVWLSMVDYLTVHYDGRVNSPSFNETKKK